MNVHERWLMMKNSRHMFKEALKARDAYLIPNTSKSGDGEEARDTDPDS
jgi:hypothetical protein